MSDWKFSNFRKLDNPIIDKFGIKYYSVENAYQASKSNDANFRSQISIMDPAMSKKMGRKVELVDNWDEIKVDVMRKCLRQKFGNNDDLKKELIDADENELHEINYWHDNYWGKCGCDKCKDIEKMDMMFVLLKEIRKEKK